jgi:hypothetical protein
MRVADELPCDVGVVPAFHVGGFVAFELFVGREERFDEPLVGWIVHGRREDRSSRMRPVF